ncbi:MAG: DUF1508 domain-containing protein [Candidatus Bathyarchaeota archaeon]|nr:DUF1508 domain-containing protein [Candidatus Bathyarchaeota archaeon]
MVEAMYLVYKDAADQYRFRLRAPNTEIIAVSQGYSTRQGCLNGIAAVQRNRTVEIEDQTADNDSIANPKFQVYRDAADKYRFRLRARA